ncbi:MAG TPA: PEGA domain-containing protein [Polyangiaceae bacterium]|nr:PEGA domain-containing protein [Polyangiaceae bacterium]
MRSRTALAATLVVATLTAAVPAAAAPPWVEADDHFRHGVALYNEHDFATALVEFQRAYEIDPKYQVLYNIGETYYLLLDYANALKSLQKYLDDGGTKITPKRRKEVEAEIATLRGRVAKLTIETTEAGASVTVDDVAVGKTPLAGLTVSAGRRRVTATVPGRVPVTQIVDLAGGDERTIELEIPAAPDSPDRPKPSAPPPPPPSIIPTVVTWSATGAVVTGAIVTGILALGASSDVETELARFPGDPEALASAHSSAFGFGLATDILIGTSVAAAALSVYFTVDWALESDAASRAPAPSARITVLPGAIAVGATF